MASRPLELDRDYIVNEYKNSDVDQLDEIDLTNRGFTSISPSTFPKPNNCLNVLKLSENLLTKIARSQLENLVKLSELWLSNNQIESLELDALVNLTRLDLDNNQLTAQALHPKLFSNLHNLSVLYLYENQIDSLDAALFQNCPNLSVLYLNFNHLNSLDPKTFEACKSLSKLELSNNRLAALDKSLFQACTNLNEVHIDYNRIKSLPDAELFAKCRALAELYIGYNQIETVNEHLFDACHQLSILKLMNNDLKSIPQRLFSSSLHLAILDLSNNHLKNIESKTFDACKSLQELYLNSNKIETLDPGTFKSLKSLVLLRLDKNLLKSIGDHTFQNCTSLVELYLNHNNFASSKLDPELFKGLHDLKELYIIDDDTNSLLEYRDKTGNKNQRTKPKHTPREVTAATSMDYDILEVLEDGHFGNKTFLIQDQDTLKVMQRIINKFKKNERLELQKEFDRIKNIDCQYIAEYYDFCFQEFGADSFFFMVTEYFEEGDLNNLIEKTKIDKKSFSDKQIMDWTSQLLTGLETLHSNKVIHKDIKPKNVFLKNQILKLGNISLLNHNSHHNVIPEVPSKNQTVNLPSSFAQVNYTSPEILKGTSSFNNKSDVWSLGCTIYELVKLECLFKQSNSTELYDSVVNFDSSSITLSNEILEGLLKSMLNKNSQERLSSKELYDKLKLLNMVADFKAV